MTKSLTYVWVPTSERFEIVDTFLEELAIALKSCICNQCIRYS